MSHKVGKQSNIIELIEEVLGKAMAERVWIDNFTIQTVLVCKMLQLNSDTSCGDAFPIAIEEDVATRNAFVNQPLRGSKLNCVIVLFFLLASKISFHIEFIFRYLSESKIMVYLID